MNRWSLTFLQHLRAAAPYVAQRIFIAALIWAAALPAGLIPRAWESTASADPVSDKDQFDDFEIRVIRNKYFQKRNRLEVGAQMAVVMNQSFIYTYLATGVMAFHFAESLALEGTGAFGFSVDKEDKRILEDQFSVYTEILRTSYLMEGALQWTPMYGKFQLPHGKIIYFDTYLVGGAGLHGIEYKYDWCFQSKQVEPVPAPRTVSYLGFVFGVGQRYFLDDGQKNKAIKWDIRDHVMSYSSADTACGPGRTPETRVHHAVTMQVGAGYYF